MPGKEIDKLSTEAKNELADIMQKAQGFVNKTYPNTLEGRDAFMLDIVCGVYTIMKTN